MKMPDIGRIPDAACKAFDNYGMKQRYALYVIIGVVLLFLYLLFKG